jgi:hypothetical protein
MKKLNTLMTREYNRMTGHSGTLWERRFRSAIVERGKASLLTGAYIDLNSFRASLVSQPENYEYSSLWWLKQGNRRDLVSSEILDEYFHVSAEMGISDREKETLSRPEKKYRRKRSMYIRELYRRYVKFVYEQGTRAPKRKLIRGRTDSLKITEQMQQKLEEKITAEAGAGEDQSGTELESEGLQRGAGLCRKRSFFSRGRFIGSKGFAKAVYTEHVDPGYKDKSRSQRHKCRWMHSMEMEGGLWGVFNGSRQRQSFKIMGKEKDAATEENHEKSEKKWFGREARSDPPI